MPIYINQKGAFRRGPIKPIMEKVEARVIGRYYGLGGRDPPEKFRERVARVKRELERTTLTPVKIAKALGENPRFVGLVNKELGARRITGGSGKKPYFSIRAEQFIAKTRSLAPFSSMSKIAYSIGSDKKMADRIRKSLGLAGRNSPFFHSLTPYNKLKKLVFLLKTGKHVPEHASAVAGLNKAYMSRLKQRGMLDFIVEYMDNLQAYKVYEARVNKKIESGSTIESAIHEIEADDRKRDKGVFNRVLEKVGRTEKKDLPPSKKLYYSRRLERLSKRIGENLFFGNG